MTTVLHVVGWVMVDITVFMAAGWLVTRGLTRARPPKPGLFIETQREAGNRVGPLPFPDDDVPNDQGWHTGEWVRYTSTDENPGIIVRTGKDHVWVDWTPSAFELSVAMIPTAFYWTNDPACPLVHATFADPGTASPEDIERWLEE